MYRKTSIPRVRLWLSSPQQTPLCTTLTTRIDIFLSTKHTWVRFYRSCGYVLYVFSFVAITWVISLFFCLLYSVFIFILYVYYEQWVIITTFDGDNVTVSVLKGHSIRWVAVNDNLVLYSQGLGAYQCWKFVISVPSKKGTTFARMYMHTLYQLSRLRVKQFTGHECCLLLWICGTWYLITGYFCVVLFSRYG